MSKVLLFTISLLLFSCAPVAPSVDKHAGCDAYKRSASIEIGDTFVEVDSKMGLNYVQTVDSNNDIVWTYDSCTTIVVIFSANEVVRVIR